MKKYLALVIFNIVLINFSFSSNDCNSANFLCLDNSYSYSASINESGPSWLTNYSCLGTAPNPEFFIFQIDNSGNITIDITTDPSVDVDFICWGPFTDTNNLCGNINSAPVEDCS